MLCAHAFGVNEKDIVSPRRDAPSVQARHVAIYLARQMTPLSLPAIGRLFGGRDHTTILHAVRRVDALLSHDAWLRAGVVQIERDVAALAAAEGRAA